MYSLLVSRDSLCNIHFFFKEGMYHILYFVGILNIFFCRELNLIFILLSFFFFMINDWLSICLDRQILARLPNNANIWNYWKILNTTKRSSSKTELTFQHPLIVIKVQDPTNQSHMYNFFSQAIPSL